MCLLSQNRFAEALQKNWKEGDVAATVMRAINEVVQPANKNGEEISHELVNENATAAMKKIESFPTSGYAIQLVLFGENHTSEKDHDRGNSIIKNLDSYPASLVVFERAMTQFYATSGLLHNHEIVREENLYKNELLGVLQARERSMVMAGFLVAYIAKKATPTNVILFFGEEHKNILEKYFDYFARHSNADWLLFKKRRFYVVRSLG